MASLVLSGDTSGSITVSAPAVAGSNTQTLVATTGTLAPIVSGTAVASTSGTSIDFTGIPSWVKRITVMFSGVSTNGTGVIQIQLGDSGGIENSGYSGAVDTTVAAVSAELFTTGLAISRSGVMSATAVFSGQAVFSLVGSNSWVGSGLFARTNTAGVSLTACTKTLSDTLTQLRVIGSATGSPADTFDAGTINILYE